MKSNEAAFRFLLPVTGHAQRRDYPVGGDSPILSMTDVVWSQPFPRDSAHSHNCMEIGLCVQGRGTICIGERTCEFSPETVVIVPEGVRHFQKIAAAEASRWRYIAVSEERLMMYATPSARETLSRLIGAGQAGGFVLQGDAMTQDVVWLMERMFDIKCRFSGEATAQLEAMCLLILTRVAREPMPDWQAGERRAQAAQPVEPALLYISEQYRSEIKIGQLARSCAMSESYFRKVFQEATGMTPVEYLNRYRIERAVHMIKTRRGESVSHVAEACGFSSIATFNRNFLRYTGQSPSDMKRSCAQKTENAASEIVQNG